MLYLVQSFHEVRWQRMMQLQWLAVGCIASTTQSFTHFFVPNNVACLFDACFEHSTVPAKHYLLISGIQLKLKGWTCITKQALGSPRADNGGLHLLKHLHLACELSHETPHSLHTSFRLSYAVSKEPFLSGVFC